MKKLILAVLVFLGVLFGAAKGGEATVSDKFVFNSTFVKMVEVLKENNRELMNESFGRAKFVKQEGELITMDLVGPKDTHQIVVKVSEDINFKKKSANVVSELVESKDKFMTAQKTTISAQERDGKVYVDVTFHANIPQFGDKILSAEMKRSMSKFVKTIDSYIK